MRHLTTDQQVDSVEPPQFHRRATLPTIVKPVVCLFQTVWPLLLRLRYQITELLVVGDGLQRIKVLPGRTIICPTHPSRLDGELMFGLSRVIQEKFYYLTAREVLQGWAGLQGLLLHMGGCFAIRRGSFDRNACELLIATLVKGQNKLVIFPEGEISHHFSEVTHLLPGAARLAFLTLERMQHLRNPLEPLYILPIALAYAYQEDPRYVFDFALSKLEENLGIPSGDAYGHSIRLLAICEKLLEVLELAYGVSPESVTVDERLKHLRLTLARRIGAFFGCTFEHQDEVEFIHSLTEKLHDLLMDNRNDHCTYRQAVMRHQCDVAALLMKDLSRVVNLRFCLEKCARGFGLYQELNEVIELLEIEVIGKPLPGAKRIALISIGEPLNVLDSYSSYLQNRHQTVIQLNETLTRQIQQLQLSLLKEVESAEKAKIQPELWERYHRFAQR